MSSGDREVSLYNKTVQELEALIVNGTLRLNERTGDGQTYLMKAAGMGDSDEIVQLFLRHGADVTGTNWDNGTNALHDAASAGRTSVCRILLDHVQAKLEEAGDNEEMKKKFHRFLYRSDRERYDALHFAARGGKTETVRFLLERGAWNTIDDDRLTGGFVRDGYRIYKDRADCVMHELHSAARYGRTDVCRILLDHAASVSDSTSTDLASNKGHYEYLHSRDTCQMDALQQACERSWDNTETIKFLLQRGASVFTFSKGRNTPVHRVSDVADDEALRLLLKAADEQRQDGAVDILLRSTTSKDLPIHLVLNSRSDDPCKLTCVELFLSYVEKDPKSAANMLQAVNKDDNSTALELFFQVFDLEKVSVVVVERMLQLGALVTEKMIQTLQEKTTAAAPPIQEKGTQLLDIVKSKWEEQKAAKKRKKEEQAAKRAAAKEAKKRQGPAAPVRRSARRS